MDNHEISMFCTYQQDSVTFHEVNLYARLIILLLSSAISPPPKIFFWGFPCLVHRHEHFCHLRAGTAHRCWKKSSTKQCGQQLSEVVTKDTLQEKIPTPSTQHFCLSVYFGLVHNLQCSLDSLRCSGATQDPRPAWAYLVPEGTRYNRIYIRPCGKGWHRIANKVIWYGEIGEECHWYWWKEWDEFVSVALTSTDDFLIHTIDKDKVCSKWYPVLESHSRQVSHVSVSHSRFDCGAKWNSTTGEEGGKGSEVWPISSLTP